MNLYKAFYKNQSREVKADSMLDARDKAAAGFKAKRAYDVTVLLVAKDIDGPKPEQVVHSTGSL